MGHHNQRGPVGNRFAAGITTHGPALDYTPDELRAKGAEYVKYCHENPIASEEVSVSKGEVTRYTKWLRRPPTMVGFASFLGVSEMTLYNWRKNKVLCGAMGDVSTWIKEGQQEGGLVGQFNPMMVSRLTGLAEQVELTVSGSAEAAPKPEDRMVANLIHPDCTDDQLDAIYAAGLQPMLYSAAQLEAGMPWIMPELPLHGLIVEHIEADDDE